MTALTPVMLVRRRFGTAGEAARIVHLISVPVERSAAVRALCGEVLNVHDIETVGVGEGMPCNVCLLNQVINTPDEPSTGSTDETDATAAIDGTTYQAWGWPVARRGDQIRLDLNGDVSAIAIPAELGIEVTQLLTARRCAPAVLAHPDMPEHHIVLIGERYGVRLSWPFSVHQITGSLLLPPTTTCCGPVTWTRQPHDGLAAAVSRDRCVRRTPHRAESLTQVITTRRKL